MTCTRSRMIAELDGAAALRERSSAHAAECRECRAGWAALARIERACSSPVAGPTDRARAEMWRNISLASQPPAPLSRLFPVFVFSAAAAGVAALIFVKSEEGPPDPKVRVAQEKPALPREPRRAAPAELQLQPIEDLTVQKFVRPAETLRAATAAAERKKALLDSSKLNTPAEKTEIEPPYDPETHLREADQKRQNGELAAAAAIYDEVASRPEGHIFAEEAMLRRARILHQLQRAGEALDVLLRARARFPRGELEPERVVFEAKLHLERGAVAESAEVLELVSPGHEDLLLERTRLEVAEKLADSDREGALRLVSAVLGAQSIPKSLRRAAEALDRRLQKN